MSPGEHNTPDNLPQYCPPEERCQIMRLAGGTCYPPQGTFEPVVCKKGYYCPLGGREQIQCPAGHYCLPGSYKPTSCTVGSQCPLGSSRDMSFLPPGLILAFDSLMILVLVGWRVFSRPRSARSPPSRASRSTRSFMKKASTFAADRTPGLTQYQSLEDDDINLEARIINVRRMDTGFGGAFDAASFVRESTTVSERPKSDLDLFIQSMSKSMDTGRFGLSFEFTNLMFKPKSAATPVLSEVTGQISQGSLWGVMGASGAGKST